uniref:Uncharacterized protein n=1 Tax=Corethron hystrix TaxID=216773 RepID=A0A7S1FPD4_9STRA|mmetsp:Transcript_20525/g.46574  ORF Transcript_20525/g.46574 Transcript_20525/m.46574 type:complete len:328 (+) Transcript_20525:108-1091(+)
MPSPLVSTIQKSIASFLAAHPDSNPSDLLRVLTRESNLAFEKSLLIDALEKDPFQLFRIENGVDRGKLAKVQKRIGRVTDVTRKSDCTVPLPPGKDFGTTIEIRAEVEFLGSINGDHAGATCRAVFSFRRSPVWYENPHNVVNDTASSPTKKKPKTNLDREGGSEKNGKWGTRLQYTVDMSFIEQDLPTTATQQHRCLSLEIDGASTFPCDTSPAQPMPTIELNEIMEEEEIEFEWRKAHWKVLRDEIDQYTFDWDPSIADKWWEMSGMKNIFEGEETQGEDDMLSCEVLYLLLVFPYYEHEWDVPGLILESVFGSEEEEEDEDAEL